MSAVTTERTHDMSAIALAVPAPERGRIRSALTGGRRKYLAIGLALLLLPGAALAAWTVSSHGRGAAKAGTLKAPTVAQGTPSDTDTLLPGGDAALTFQITNDNPLALNVASVDAGPDGVISSDQSNCPASNVSVPSLRSLNVSVPKGSSTVTIPGAIHMAADAPSSCSGVTFTPDVALGFST